jgi:hypothetical protein
LNALVCYTADFLNAGVERLVGMGKDEAEKIAGNFVRNYQASHKLSASFGSIDASIVSIADEIRHALIAYGRWKTAGVTALRPDAVAGLGPRLEQLLLRTGDIGFVAVTEQGYLRRRVLLLRNPAAFVEAYLSMNDDSRAGKKLFYKTSEIVALIGDTRSRVRLYENLTGNDAASGRSSDYRPNGTVILLDSAA